MKLRAALLLTLLMAAPAITACGKVGDLERPAPLWGPDERAKEEAAKRAASERANKPSKPGSLQEVRDPASSSATITQQPIAGTNDPFGKPPQ
jgi:predicted small lipoprotein YifL